MNDEQRPTHNILSASSLLLRANEPGMLSQRCENAKKTFSYFPNVGKTQKRLFHTFPTLGKRKKDFFILS
ncbi:MAG: hypothetical protein LBN98_04865, partial [Prevotellaceae bacterium]|nr:hypothetical protein [Prevotellaceae bacterium]